MRINLNARDIASVLPPPDGTRLVDVRALHSPQRDTYEIMFSFDSIVGSIHCSYSMDALEVMKRERKGLDGFPTSIDENLIRGLYAQARAYMDGKLGAIHGTTNHWPTYLFSLFNDATWPDVSERQRPPERWHPEYMDAWDGDRTVTPEGRIKARLNKGLKSLNLVWKYMPVPSGYGMQSLDYLLCVAGHFVAIETKAPGKHPTPRQETTIAAIKEAGGLVFVVDSDESVDACIGGLAILTQVQPR